MTSNEIVNHFNTIFLDTRQVSHIYFNKTRLVMSYQQGPFHYYLPATYLIHIWKENLGME